MKQRETTKPGSIPKTELSSLSAFEIDCHRRKMKNVSVTDEEVYELPVQRSPVSALISNSHLNSSQKYRRKSSLAAFHHESVVCRNIPAASRNAAQYPCRIDLDVSPV